MTRRFVTLIIATAVATPLALAAPAEAAPTKFTSCTSMHKVYKYGIAKNKKAQKRGVRDGMHKPPVKAKVYADSYKSLDRDKDGIMCEVPK